VAFTRYADAEAAGAVQTLQVRARMLRFAGVPVGSIPKEFPEFLRAERSKWGKLIREAKLKLD
jgi:tripartite-type tricarboxylate transporter receptor subunit TctC